MYASFKRLYVVSLILELCGVITAASGIAVELAFKAELGYTLITVGSLIIALGGLLWSKVLRLLEPKPQPRGGAR